MVAPAVDVRETPFPAQARQPGQESARAFAICSMNWMLAVLYAKEPFLDDGSLGIHVSVSKTCRLKPVRVTDCDLGTVERIIKANGLEWPKLFSLGDFREGPSAGFGLHVWEEK